MIINSQYVEKNFVDQARVHKAFQNKDQDQAQVKKNLILWKKKLNLL